MKQILIFYITVFANVVLAQDTTRLSLLFLGDIMQHDSQINDAYDPSTKKYDYNPCFQFVKKYVQDADLAIGNLELTLAGPPYKGYPQFSAPDELLFGLQEMGVDVLVTANNHCVDTGKKGLERTIKMLDSLSVPHTGTFLNQEDKKKNHPLIVKKNGVSLAILNYTYGTNGLPVTKPNIVNMLDTAAMGKDLKLAKSMSPDMMVVFVHWGAEYQSLPSKGQRDIAEYCFKKGAQLVIGAHPHVLQPMEWRKDKNQLVVYSLGNFVSGQRKRYTDGGGMITIDISKVTFPDQSSITTIDSANYILEWVYRTTDAQKNYYVLPLPMFENDTLNFIKDEASRQALKLFADDSRALFKKHNINITESTIIPPDSLTRFKVLLPSYDEQADSLTYVPYGVESLQQDQENYLFSGEFKTKQQADKYRDQLIRLGADDAVVRKFVNGVLVEE